MASLIYLLIKVLVENNGKSILLGRGRKYKLKFSLGL